MAQRFALVAAAGLVAFTVVFMGALGTYVVLKGPAANTAASLAQGNDVAASIQAPTEGSSRQSDATQGPGSAGSDPSNGYPVSSDEAVNIALNNTPGASLVQQPRLVRFNGTVAYEVHLDKGYVYVDATSGQVLSNGASGANPQRPQRSRRWGR